MNEVKKFTVRRDTWLRGKKDGRGNVAAATLMNYHSNMCCLGFLGQACGYDAGDLKDVADPETMFAIMSPDDLTNVQSQWPKHLVNRSNDTLRPLITEICSAIIRVNDDTDLTDDEREKQLTDLFQSVDIEVAFEGPRAVTQ